MSGRGSCRLAFAAALVLALGASSAEAATIQVINLDGLNEGFNDPTVVAPIGGNPGTTLGQQRLNVFSQAAAIWGAILPSSVTIRVDATMDPLTPCSSTGGVLGSTGPNEVFANFGGQPVNDTWYVAAEANKLHGTDLSGANDMRSRFNSSVDNSTCLGTSNWYYGYDHNEGTNVDLLAVVMHELGHGLGFVSLVDGASGNYYNGMSDIFTKYLYDDTQQLYWDQLTSVQRAASAINNQRLVWRGPNTAAAAPSALSGIPYVRFDGAAAVTAGVSGERAFGSAAFGPPLGNPPISADVVYINDPVAPTGDGCETPWTNEGDLAGKIALIDRGLCAFTLKVEYAASKGAVGVIIANNVASPAIVNMAGVSATTIPAVSITQADGNLLKTALSLGTVTATLGTHPEQLAGADAQGYPLMYAPNPLQPGSSVSHFDVSALPDALMEPGINTSLTSNVDLTRYVFSDIGWFQGLVGVTVRADAGFGLAAGPNPFRVQTSIHYSLPQSGLTDMVICDLAGRMVKQVMAKSWLPAGAGTIVWDGTNQLGQRVPAGLYFYRMRSNQTAVTQRVVVAD